MECDILAAAVWLMIFVLAVIAIYFRYKIRLAEVKAERQKKKKKKWFSNLVWGVYIVVMGIAFAFYGTNPDILWPVFVVGAGIAIVISALAERCGLE